MGVAVSGWRLAAAVARTGQLGVVSGTALAAVLARRLQDGDPGGHLRRALAAFPDQTVAERILARYLRSDRQEDGGYRAVPVPRHDAGRHALELTVAAAFVEVHLAKEGHDGQVGINLLEKIQIPTLPTLYGALLAGVDWVLMGAGIPLHIPPAIERLAEHHYARLPLTVAGASREHMLSFDPATVIAAAGKPLERPRFLAIVSSHLLASHLARSEDGRPDGFVVEAAIAGGHNAPPRGRLQLDGDGEPIYGPRDEVDLAKMREIGLPFWLAGGYADPQSMRQALEQGACGVQVGTAFALCEESGLDGALRAGARTAAAAQVLRVRTDPLASPTGYPFKVVPLAGTAADPAVARSRTRRCDLRYLTVPFERADGRVGYRCPAEPVDDYVAKGGDPGETEGRLCLCNGLMAAAGLPQQRDDGAEAPLLTLGDDVHRVVAALSPDGRPYHAADVVAHILG